MAKPATIADRIEALIVRMDGATVCDACINDRLDLSSIAQTAVVTLAAGGRAGFERLKTACDLCLETKLGIRFKP